MRFLLRFLVLAVLLAVPATASAGRIYAPAGHKVVAFGP